MICGKTVRDPRKTKTLDWRLERWNYALLLKYVRGDRTPSGFEIFVFKTHARPRAHSQLRNRALDFKNRISLPSERNFVAACVLRFFVVREHVHSDAFCSFSLCFGGWFLFFGTSSVCRSVDVREHP